MMAGSGLWLGLLGTHALAEEIRVSSMSALQSAINSASAGDTVILANGTYSNATLTIGASGIVVRAASPGGVYLNGTQSVAISGSAVTFSGFQFTSGDIGGGQLIQVSGSHNLLTQLNFNGYFAKTYVVIDSGTQYNEISYCNIENKPAAAVTGAVIQVHTSSSQPNYHRIRYCAFRNFPGPGGDYGNEPVRLGLGAERDNVSRTVVEHCYFDNVGLGDGESVSVKSSENVCRYNTFANNPEGMLVFRNGDRNAAYGNFFIKGSGGIRVKEADSSYCYNNYFETSGVASSKEALMLDYVAPYPRHVVFVHNTFVECGTMNLGGVGPTSVTFANNIFKKSVGNIFTNPNGQTSWVGNIYSGSLGIAVAPGLTNIDPQLAMNGNGFYGLSSSSPAINASSASYPAIMDVASVDDDPLLMLDIGGQSRPAAAALKDAGCDEYASGAGTNRPLTLADVGPAYLGGPSTRVGEERPDMAIRALPSGYQLFDCFPNPFNPSTTIHVYLSSASSISLKVYDRLGREVSTLVEGVRPAGEHSVQWNASGQPSGVYVCRLLVNGSAVSRTMVLVK